MQLPTHCHDCGAYLMGGATEHKPGCSVQQMIDYATTGRVQNPVCDFCSDPKPAYSLGCATFDTPELNTKSVDAWLACPHCYELVQGKKWHELAVRGMELTSSGQMLAGYLGKADAIMEIKNLHQGFRDHATGEVKAL